MLKNIKEFQGAEKSAEARAGLKDHMPANDNLAVLSDHLLSAFEEPVNDNEEPEDHRALGVAIPADRFTAGDLDGAEFSFAEVADEVAELDFAADRIGTRGFLSE